MVEKRTDEQTVECVEKQTGGLAGDPMQSALSFPPKQITNLHTFHLVAENMTEAVRLAMRDTSIDMSMNPPLATGFFEAVVQLVRSCNGAAALSLLMYAFMCIFKRQRS